MNRRGRSTQDEAIRTNCCAGNGREGDRDRRMIRATVKGIDVVFETSAELFSPQAIDRGTLAMLSVVEFGPTDKVLDLGCGYGVVGIVAAKLIGAERVVMLDNDPAAVALAKRNTCLNGVDGVSVVLSDGFRELGETGFTLILSNPPYHADFSVAKHFIEKGFNRLVVGGRMYMVTRRELWYKKKLASIFGGVTMHRGEGYTVFEAIKERARRANA